MFLKKKCENSNDKDATSFEEITFQCEHCANTFKTENGLNIHVGKSHKDLTPSLSPEKICDNPKEPSLNVSPLRETVRENIETEEEEEDVEIVQRTFSVESLCNVNRLNDWGIGK